MPKLHIPQKKLTLDVESGAPLMHTLLKADIPVASSCDGEGICSMCRVQIEGNLSPPDEFESNSLMRNKVSSGERLACQVLITGDITVKTSYW